MNSGTDNGNIYEAMANQVDYQTWRKLFRVKQLKQTFYHNKSQVERVFRVDESVRVRIPDRGLKSQSVKWSPARCCLEGVWWSAVSCPSERINKTRVHAGHLITALENENSLTDLGDSFEERSCLP